MAGFSSATLERIRAASDIVDVIGSCLPLKKAGANFVALCPFHKEKTPSFNMNPHRQIFHCFGCHQGGDVFAFVKEYENIGFVDAVRRLVQGTITRAACHEEILIATRQYAKRQRTWFRHQLPEARVARLDPTAGDWQTSVVRWFGAAPIVDGCGP